ncbi:MAG: hypothetical protein WCY09_08030 [Candidatus Omnitrophota bacterium]|jgi:hypothetical protein
MAKNSPKVVDAPVKMKPTIRIEEDDFKDIKSLKIDSKVVFSGVGIVRLLEKQEWNDDKLVCQIEIKNLKVENTSKEEEDEMAEMDIDDLEAYKRIKALKKKAQGE